jgi:UDP-N-acetylglucosamine diphosphorylase/glucosamine-1-phosphate N-acetyltransferase
MRICIYEDRQVRGLEPLTLTRPTIDLLCGLTTLGEKQARYFSATAIGHLCRPLVAEQIRSRDPIARVNDAGWLRAAPTVLVNARWIPPTHTRSVGLMASRRGVGIGSSNLFGEGSFLGTVEGEIAFAVLDTRLLPAVSPSTLDDCLADWIQSLPTHEVGGVLVSRLWDMIERNSKQISRDFDAVADRGVAGFHPNGFAIVGHADKLIIHPSACIDPMVVADTTHGPVVIGAAAVIHAFTRLEGPCSIGEGSVLLGAKVRAGTSIGPRCRMGGEIEHSIVLGHSNKYHDGFLGHSYLGEWVNLAAGTSTSDLRCDYRNVTVLIDGREVQTNQLKVGAMIGDHAKTGLGVMLDCGTIIGPFASVLPTGSFAPRSIPGFTRAGSSGLKLLTDVDRLLATAEAVMHRRGKELTPVLDTIYRSLAAHRPQPDIQQQRKAA